MSRHKEANKRTKHISRNLARIAGLFTSKNCVVLLVLAAAALAVPAWRSWKSYWLARTTETQLKQMTGLEGSAIYADEVLTMSSNMAAATGQTKWVTRYEQFGRRTRPTIQENWHVSEEDTITEEAVLTGFAADKLAALETEALELVRQGKRDQAAALLDGQEYDDQKRAYNRGMNEFVANVRRVLEVRRDKHWKNFRATSTAISIILPAIVLVWLAVRTAQRRICERAAARHNASSFVREWQETFNAITDGVCIIDRNGGKILQCNRAMTRFLKKPYGEILGRSCCELLHGSSKPVRRCPLVRMFETRRSETTDFQVDDRWLKVKVDPLIDNEGHLVGAVHILSDITEHRKATKALRESENKFRLAFANAQDAIVWIDSRTGTITNCNKATEELLGRRRKEIVGRHHTTLYPEDKAEHYDSLLAESGRGTNSNIEAEIIRRGGEIRTVTVAVSTMWVEGKEIAQGIIRDITESKRAIEEIKSLAKFPSEDPNPVLRISTDGSILYFNDASSPVLQTWQVREGQSMPELWLNRIEEVYRSGNSSTYELHCYDGHAYFITLQPIVGAGYVNAYGLDITELKKAEKEKMELELQLGQKQKMEAIGTLAGGIAHDFNNILAGIQGYVELALDDLSQDSPVRDNLEQVMSCTNRATKLVKQILTFSRKDQQEREKEPVRLSSIIKEGLEMLRSSLPATIKISRNIQSESAVVMADPTQIHQVLVNLCTNASHAMRDTGGRLEVSLTDVDLESETRIGDEHLGRGHYAKLSVSDSGCGMEKDVLERIFEPFFTTKNVNEGTGLGLSVVHGIIKSHDGAIAVSSTPGEGTTFDIFLPKIESGQAQEPQSPESAAGKKDVILLVDDEEMMVDVIGQLLDRLGYAVVGKTSSIDALEAFQAEPDKFDLVITDQVMPNMTGTELSRNLISVRPDIPVILFSGYPERIIPEELKSVGIKEFITKPISRQEIAEVIQRVLDPSRITA